MLLYITSQEYRIEFARNDDTIRPEQISICIGVNKRIMCIIAGKIRG